MGTIRMCHIQGKLHMNLCYRHPTEIKYNCHYRTFLPYLYTTEELPGVVILKIRSPLDAALQTAHAQHLAGFR
jgi:hypothetical protein